MRTPAHALLLFAGLTASQTPVCAQSDIALEGAVRELLTFSEFETIPEQLAESLADQVLPIAGGLSGDRETSLRQAVSEEFSLEAMRGDVVASLVEAGDPVVVSDLLEWLPSGATAELDRIRREYEPQSTLEEYALELNAQPPPDDRILAVASWARTQQAALFFLGMQKAQTEAALTIARALNDEAPDYTPLTDAQTQQALQTFLGVAVISFLWALEPASNELIQRATEEYDSASGQWFVTSYSLAVEEAIGRAALRVAERLSG